MARILTDFPDDDLSVQPADSSGAPVYETDADRRTLRVSVVAALVLTAVSLVLGYRRIPGHGSVAPGFASSASLQLFALDAPRDLSADSLAIGVARFTAPLALVMASVVAVTALVGQTVRHSARLRRIKEHVVVLGLSDNSSEFTNALLEQRRPVVVVEIDGEHPGLQAMKRSGALVVVGDASREATQRLAHVERSSRVIVSTGDDGRNLRTAETAARLLEDSRETTVHVLLEDYWLHEELARTEFMTGCDDRPGDRLRPSGGLRGRCLRRGRDHSLAGARSSRTSSSSRAAVNAAGGP